MLKVFLALVLGMSSLTSTAFAADGCYASCNYRDEGAGSTFVGESKTSCADACTKGEKLCLDKARGACKKIKCLSNCPADQSSNVKSDMDALAQLEKLNPELQTQVAGNCVKFWDNNLGKYDGVSCTSPIQGAVTWGLIGLLIGSLGSASTMTAATVGGAIFGYILESN